MKLGRPALTALVAAATMAFIGLGASPAAAANKGTDLKPGEFLLRGDYLKRGAWELRMQDDGNLVYYRGSTPCGFRTDTTNSANPLRRGWKAQMQDDGNLVVVDGNFNPLWASSNNNSQYELPRRVGQRLALYVTPDRPFNALVFDLPGRPANRDWVLDGC